MVLTANKHPKGAGETPARGGREAERRGRVLVQVCVPTSQGPILAEGVCPIGDSSGTGRDCVCARGMVARGPEFGQYNSCHPELL